MPATIHHLPRGHSVDRPLSQEECRRILERAGLTYRKPVVDRIADALDSPFGLGLFVGFIVGSFVTVMLAYFWEVLS